MRPAARLLPLRPAMSSLLHEIRIASRLLRHSPGLALAATLTIALGIGANVTIYAFADAVLFRTLDVPDADRLVHGFERRVQPGTFPLSFAEYLHVRDRARSFEALAAHYPTAPLHLVVDEVPDSITGALVTASYFEVLQLSPAIGRFFSADEDRVRGRDAVAVIGHGFWQRRFGGDPTVLGRPVMINGRAFTIIGVAPEGFTGVQPRGPLTEVWIPAALFDVGYRFCDAFDRSCKIVHLLGRLRTSTPLALAARELDGLASQFQADPNDHGRLGLVLVPARGLAGNAVSSERRQVNLFVGVVSIVLVIACANIAGLLLARATARRRDIAVRLAVGASRAQIGRHIVAESLVLAFLGGAAGVLAATWGVELLGALYAHDSAGRPLAFTLTLDARVLAAALALILVTTVLTSVAPAWHVSRADLIATLKDEGASGGARRARLRTILVTAQVALSVVLLVGAGLLIRSMRQALAGPGFDPSAVITLRLRPSLVDYPRVRAHAFQRDVIRALEALPGVASASPSVFLSMFSAGPLVAAADASRPNETVDAAGNAVGPRYFETLGIALHAGREFEDGDREGASPVAIVNDVLARRLWPDRPATGQVLLADGRAHTVIGVAADAQYYQTGEPPRSQVFYSYWQTTADDAFSSDSRTFVRVTGDAHAMMPTVLRTVAGVDAAVPVSESHPLADRVAYAFQPVRMARALLTGVAALAVALVAVGLYGVLAFAVAQRTREIGLRFALGATPAHVRAMILRDGLRVVLSGVTLGVIAAWNTAHFASTLLFGVEARDPWTFAVATAVLAIVALAASYLPARRASRVSPLMAIRTET